jgi:hypothetical protein
MRMGNGEYPHLGVCLRIDAVVGRVRDVSPPARPAAGTTVQEIEMSKGNRGNKEAKKPKRVMPVVRSPITDGAATAAPRGVKPVLQKK